MSWLLEDPTMLIIVGGLAEVALVFALIRTGRGSILGLMAGVLLLVAGLVALERFVVTDVERVQNTIYDTAGALEANQLPAVLEFISPEAVHMRDRASLALSYAELQEVSIRDLNVTVNNATTPPTARAVFFARVNGSYGRGDVPYQNGIFRFRVDLEKPEDRWLLTDYDILEGLKPPTD